jgi:hypothetical protein
VRRIFYRACATIFFFFAAQQLCADAATVAGSRRDPCLRADFARANKTASNGGAQSFPTVLSSAAFVSIFTPPEYTIAGILQRRFIYSFTGATGAGKTAIMLLLAAHVALGRNISPQHEVEKGRVLYLAGENPTDCQMRWIAMAQQFKPPRRTGRRARW